MGKILLYKPGRACQALLAKPTQSGSYSALVHPFKAIDGTEKSALLYYSNNFSNSMENIQFYDGLTGYASADTENDFSLNHYTIRDIPGVTYSRTSSAQTGGKVYTIQVTNTGSEAITVGSIKFTKTIHAMAGESQSNLNCVILGYFFDEPVTIEAGTTKTFAVNFDS